MFSSFPLRDPTTKRVVIAFHLKFTTRSHPISFLFLVLQRETGKFFMFSQKNSLCWVYEKMSLGGKSFAAIWCFVFNLISLLFPIITCNTHCFLSSSSGVYSWKFHFFSWQFPRQGGRSGKELNNSWTFFRLFLLFELKYFFFWVVFVRTEGLKKLLTQVFNRKFKEPCNSTQPLQGTSKEISLNTHRLPSKVCCAAPAKIDYFFHASRIALTPSLTLQTCKFQNLNWFHFPSPTFRLNFSTCCAAGSKAYSRESLLHRRLHDQLGFGGDYLRGKLEGRNYY